MNSSPLAISFPELFFGIVAPIGVDLRGCVESLKQALRDRGYTPVEIKVTNIFCRMKEFITPIDPLDDSTEYLRYKSYIAYGNQLRRVFEDDAALAVLTIARISRKRLNSGDESRFERVAYIIHQFKRKEEIDLMRSVYGKQFFQISVYSRRGARVDYLASRFASAENNAGRSRYFTHAEEMVQRDYNESDDHGQRVVKIFHDGDVIINIDTNNPNFSSQIDRFVRLVFGSNRISPTKIEYGMFIAKAAALRTLDLSRQVGAAIFSEDGEIISLGSNEVPRAHGGTYWCDDPFDDREHVRGQDSNEQRKKEILLEILSMTGARDKFDDRSVKDSQFMDALEYGRIIHAEMSAIVDAARLGRSTRNAALFCTTFPCHMCAKHIVGAGLRHVYFLEPYPKSLVSDLHNDSIDIEGNDRGRFSSYPAVVFKHFHGVSPRRYRELFERGSRKANGKFVEWIISPERPNMRISMPNYVEYESSRMQTILSRYMQCASFDVSVFDD
jgi:deoxycytidylate deaminase